MGYSANVDCWSLGAILYVLLAGVAPFDDAKPMPIFRGDEDDEYLCPVEFSRPSVDFWDTVSHAAKDLIRRLMCVNPYNRYSSAEARRHPWLTGESMAGLDAERQSDVARIRAQREAREAERAAAEEQKINEAVQARLAQQLQQQQQQQQQQKTGSGSGSGGDSKRKREELEVDFYGKDLQKPQKRRRPECAYGSRCYRQNPQHFAEFAHPQLWSDSGNDGGGNSGDDGDYAASDDSSATE
jgi:serine/threonine protein kinase